MKNSRLITPRKDCILNVGDDCAVIICNKSISRGCSLFLVFLAITRLLSNSVKATKKYIYWYENGVMSLWSLHNLTCWLGLFDYFVILKRPFLRILFFVILRCSSFLGYIKYQLFLVFVAFSVPCLGLLCHFRSPVVFVVSLYLVHVVSLLYTVYTALVFL